MKNHVSSHFIPIYKRFFSPVSSPNSSDKINLLVDAVYHEQEFTGWLREKYKNELTSDTYRKLSTKSNIDAYIKKSQETKNLATEKAKREEILERLKAERLKPITKYEYDVDIVDSYFKIEKLLEKVNYDKNFIEKEDYLKVMKNPILEYCVNKGLPAKTVIQLKYPIVIDSRVQGFEAYLGRTLIAFDPNKIEAVLGYQRSIWKLRKPFASFVEHGVYNYIFHNSPFDNNERLSRIMGWVEKNRKFTRTRRVNTRKPELTLGTTETKVPDYFYWPYPGEKLKLLYDELTRNDLIEPNPTFADSFRNFGSPVKNHTIWKASLIQLVYLLYLIYGAQNQHRGILLHTVALTIFQNKRNSFTAKGLSTTFGQLSEGKKSSPGINLIKHIFDNLKLL